MLGEGVPSCCQRRLVLRWRVREGVCAPLGGGQWAPGSLSVQHVSRAIPPIGTVGIRVLIYLFVEVRATLTSVWVVFKTGKGSLVVMLRASVRSEVDTRLQTPDARACATEFLVGLTHVTTSPLADVYSPRIILARVRDHLPPAAPQSETATDVRVVHLLC